MGWVAPEVCCSRAVKVFNPSPISMPPGSTSVGDGAAKNATHHVALFLPVSYSHGNTMKRCWSEIVYFMQSGGLHHGSVSLVKAPMRQRNPPWLSLGATAPNPNQVIRNCHPYARYFAKDAPDFN